MARIVNEDRLVVKSGDKLGKYTVAYIDEHAKEVTVECDCGNVRTYKLSSFVASTGARQCNECVKKIRQKFSMDGKPSKTKYPPLDEDVSRSMIDKFIKERHEQDK